MTKVGRKLRRGVFGYGKNISSKGGPCKLSRINASEIHILLNTIGHDSNILTKEFTVATNVTASVIEVNNNIEMNVTEPAMMCYYRSTFI